MYKVIKNVKTPTLPRTDYAVICGEDELTPLMLNNKQSCEIFAYMMNKAEQDMKLLVVNQTPIDAQPEEITAKPFWDRMEKYINKTKEQWKTSINVPKEILNTNKTTICGFPAVCVLCGKDLVKECTCGKGEDKEKKVNFREFI